MRAKPTPTGQTWGVAVEKPTASRWNRPAYQNRSQTTQELILDAAERLFAERGIARTSVQEVASEAGRSIGSLYHHFDTKEVLVHAVIDRLLADMGSEMDRFFADDRWARSTIADILTAYLRGVLGLEQGRPGYKRIGWEASIANNETRSRYRATRRHANEQLRQLLLDRRSQVGHPNPDLAVSLVIDQLSAMTNSRLESSFTPTELGDVTDDAFVELALDSALTFLRYSEPDT